MWPNVHLLCNCTCRKTHNEHPCTVHTLKACAGTCKQEDGNGKWTDSCAYCTCMLDWWMAHTPPSYLIKLAQLSRVHPPFLINGLFGLLQITQVSHHQISPPKTYLRNKVYRSATVTTREIKHNSFISTLTAGGVHINYCVVLASEHVCMCMLAPAHPTNPNNRYT